MVPTSRAASALRSATHRRAECVENPPSELACEVAPSIPECRSRVRVVTQPAIIAVTRVTNASFSENAAVKAVERA